MPKNLEGRNIVGPPELVLLYLRRKNLAKARAALARRRAEQAQWTQEEWNEYREAQFHLHNESAYRNVPVGTELTRKGTPSKRRYRKPASSLAIDIEVPVRPASARKVTPKFEFARALGLSGWSAAQKEVSRRNLAKARAALKASGRPPWNKGLTKETSPMVKYLADLKRYQIEVNTKLGYWPFS